MIIITLTEQERLSNHIPEDVWRLSREQEVFIKDGVTGELVQVLDMKHVDVEESHDRVR